MTDTYSKAPLSEVIMGVTLKQPVLGKGGIIYEIINAFKNDYPIIRYGNPLEDLEMADYVIEPKIDYNHTGPVLYRLSTVDTNWMVQLQFNKIFFNWVKKDEERGKNYPGFTNVYGKYAQLVSFIQNKLNSAFSVKFCELTYQDRIFWQEHIDDLSEIDKIIKIILPSIKHEGVTYSPNNIFRKYTLPVKKAGGYAIVSINTATTKENKQVISFQCTMRGAVKDMLIDDWYKMAREMQIKLFQDSFNEKFLESLK
ncbi:MAG: TIGR04255 family protein [Candidatus Kuenenia sp.]|nr:TIGR04255 family protein [Candidatus Kuenenia hertensis]